jgi:hypothetical protein
MSDDAVAAAPEPEKKSRFKLPSAYTILRLRCHSPRADNGLHELRGVGGWALTSEATSPPADSPTAAWRGLPDRDRACRRRHRPALRRSHAARESVR